MRPRILLPTLAAVLVAFPAGVATADESQPGTDSQPAGNAEDTVSTPDKQEDSAESNDSAQPGTAPAPHEVQPGTVTAEDSAQPGTLAPQEESQPGTNGDSEQPGTVMPTPIDTPPAVDVTDAPIPVGNGTVTPSPTETQSPQLPVQQAPQDFAPAAQVPATGTALAPVPLVPERTTVAQVAPTPQLAQTGGGAGLAAAGIGALTIAGVAAGLRRATA